MRVTDAEVVVQVEPLAVTDALRLKLLIERFKRLVTVAPENISLLNGHLCTSNHEGQPLPNVLGEG